MNLLAADDVRFSYGREREILAGVSLALGPGETLGLVGESGSGKTTLLRLLLGLERPSAGAVLFEGAALDLKDRRRMRAFRRSVQPVFQDPYSSLDPRQRVFDIVAEPLRSLKVEGDHSRMVAEALRSVSLDEDAARRWPHQFSGGQRQRIAIARAIVAGPRVLLADEAVSALDLTTRVRIIDLLAALSRRTGLLFVSHDMGAVAALCACVAILEKGRIVETGPTAEILKSPSHSYTRRLLASVPRLQFEDTDPMTAQNDTAAAAHESWRKARIETLTAPEGWLNLTDRHPLEPGRWSVGTADENDIVLAAGPERLGTLTLRADSTALFEPTDGSAAIDLKADKKSPPRFRLGALLLEITTLNGSHALRVRDTAIDTTARLPAIESFPFDPAWRIRADWVALPALEHLTIDTIKGIPTQAEATHKAVFQLQGEHFELLATHGTPERPQFVFRDRTAGVTTYAACRFLFGENVTPDSIVLDFNRAINPPCAFTEHAVCPLPPATNILPVAIEAGEKKVG